MVTSQVSDVASAGARQACLAALDLQEAADIARLCLSGSKAQRIGAAQVMAGQRQDSHVSVILRGRTG